jgi:DNA polymerase
MSTAIEIATIDFETRSLRDIAAGAFVYANCPSTQVYCLAYKIGSRPTKLWHRAHPKVGIKQSPFPQDLADHILKGYLVEAHNAGFEYNVWNAAFRREFPEFPILGLEQLRCSAAKAAQFALPRSLEGACDAMQLSVRKNIDGKKVMLRVSKLPVKYKVKQVESFLAQVEIGVLDVNDVPWNEDPNDLRAVWTYCVDDVEAEHCLSTTLREMRPRELEKWKMDQRMNLRGISCDVDGARVAIDMAVQEAGRLNGRLSEITGGKVPKGSSRIKLKAWANAAGLPIQNTQADHIKEMLSSDAGKKLKETPTGQLVYEAMEIAMDVNQTSTTKYAQMLEMVWTDNRIRDMMLYYGAARTGRWSGKGVQPHNFLRGFSGDMEFAWAQIMKNDPERLQLLFGSTMKALAKATRGALIASPGKDLMVADYAAIEARVLPWLAMDEDALNIFRSGQDIYLKMAGDIYKTDPEQAEFNAYIVRLMADPTNKKLLGEIKGKFPVQRQMGKKAILGLGYQMGAEKFDDECANEDPPINMPRKFFMKVVKTYREVSFPKIASFWDDLNTAAVDAIRNPGKKVQCRMVAYKVVNQFLHCQLPSGRLLAYHHPTIRQQRTGIWEAKSKQGKEASIRVNGKQNEDNASMKQRAIAAARAAEKTIIDINEFETREQDAIFFWGQDQKTRKYVQMTTYGGSLAENVTQATAADFMGEAMLRCDATDEYDMLLSVHDELIAECDENKGDVKEFEAMMSALPDWVKPDNVCPIAAEGWRGKRYRK